MWKKLQEWNGALSATSSRHSPPPRLRWHPSGKCTLTVARDNCLYVVNLVRSHRSRRTRPPPLATQSRKNATPTQHQGSRISSSSLISLIATVISSTTVTCSTKVRDTKVKGCGRRAQTPPPQCTPIHSLIMGRLQKSKVPITFCLLDLRELILHVSLRLSHLKYQLLSGLLL